MILSAIEGPRSGPPQNRITNSPLINSILPYSARKKSANIPALYSVLNPDTSSDSPSAKSNGVRPVSAKAVINQIIAKGGANRRVQGPGASNRFLIE